MDRSKKESTEIKHQYTGLEFPQYDGTESLTKYLRRLEDFKLLIKQEKYNLILEFINAWLKLREESKFRSLTEFKDISERTLLLDLKHNRKILRQYSDHMIKKLNIQFNVNEETDSDEISDKYIITFLTRALSTIDYTLTHRITKINTFYTIRAR